VYKGLEALKEMKKGIILSCIIASLTLFADLYTKSLIIKNVERAESITVIPGFLNIVHVKNKGIAFGILNEEKHPLRPFLAGFSILALGVIIYLLLQNLNKLFETIIFSVILGSALGNLGERFFRGSVTDFIDMHIGKYHWPSYNLADAFLTISIGLLILKSMIKKELKR
jgi:signal peptidase II